MTYDELPAVELCTGTHLLAAAAAAALGRTQTVATPVCTLLTLLLTCLHALWRPTSCQHQSWPRIIFPFFGGTDIEFYAQITSAGFTISIFRGKIFSCFTCCDDVSITSLLTDFVRNCDTVCSLGEALTQTENKRGTK